MARVTNLMISNTMIGNINRHKLAMQKIEINWLPVPKCRSLRMSQLLQQLRCY